MIKYKSGLLRASLLSFTMLVPASSYALTIDQNNDATALAEALFLGLSGLEIQSADLYGYSGQSGTYTNVTGTYGLPQNGLVFSSGNVSDYGTGGNNFSGNSTEYDFGDFEGGGGESEGGDDEVVFVGGGALANQTALLEGITGQTNFFDVVQLDISFTADANVTDVSFFGVFGSEEYPEYQGSSFIDGFGLFVNGTNYASAVPFDGAAALPVNVDHESFAAISGTELDGVIAPGNNPVLRFDAPVNAGEVNNFTIILADASDGVLDTTVYLSSFVAANSGPGGGTPIAATGATEFNPLLPILNESGDPVFDENGGFIVDISDEIATNGQTVWIDPPVAVGYTYQTSNGVLVTQITAPSLATVGDVDGYSLTINGGTFTLAAGAVFDLSSIGLVGVEYFELSGIDTSLSLDPANPLAFPIGVMTDATSAFSFTITPITENVGSNPAAVPLPATGLLYIGAVLLGGGVMRRRQKAA